MAKWTHRILSPGVQPAYASNWLHELNAIATHLKFDSLDHLFAFDESSSGPDLDFETVPTIHVLLSKSVQTHGFRT